MICKSLSFISIYSVLTLWKHSYETMWTARKEEELTVWEDKFVDHESFLR